MPIVIPTGYRAVPVSQVSGPGELVALAALEEAQPEGSRLLCTLAFGERPSAEAVADLNQRCKEQGVTPWPESQDIVLADPVEPVLYVCWQKGQAWWVWILIILASTVLPPLIGAGLWNILPDSLKQMLEAVMGLLVMGGLMLMMSSMAKGITAAEGK